MSRRKSEKLANGDSEDQNENDDQTRASKRVKKTPKKDKSPLRSPPKRAATKPAADDDDESDTEYEVSKILDVKTDKKGKRQFLVNWKGYSSKDNSWEPEDHLSCSDLIEEFFEENKNKSPEKASKAAKPASKSPKSKKKKTK